MTLIDNPTWTLVDRLRKARQLADLDQSQMATLLGIARNTVSNWETGRSEPSATYFVRWAHITGVSLDWLAASVNDETAPSVDGAADDVRLKGLEPPTFWFGYDRTPGRGCPCSVNEYHGRGDCPFGCSCGWCAPELHDAFWEIVSGFEGAHA